MKPSTKVCLVITSLLLMLIPSANASTDQEPASDYLTSQMVDGTWVNNTVLINGSTTLNPQNADWTLYDVTNPYSEWDILQSGNYFTTVTPIDEGLWTWSLMINVQDINCTCWLEIGQPNGLGKEFLNRIIFIGEGPHNPIISPNHGATILVDEPVQISANAVFSDIIPTDTTNNQLNESKIIMNWCYAPNGACDGDTHSSVADVVWDYDVVSFSINASDLGLSDGIWSLEYSLQDPYLKVSPEISLSVYVDRTEPDAALIMPDTVSEGQSLIIDGSGSSDGVWSENLQYVWYITNPDGTSYVPVSNSSDGLLNVVLHETGIHTIRLDVIDWVGRMDSITSTIIVENIEPSIEFEIKGIDVTDPVNWQFVSGENISLKPIIFDPDYDREMMSYYWYLDDELVGTDLEFKLNELDEGVYNVLFIVVDDDGANATHEIEITVNSDEEVKSEGSNTAGIFALLGLICFAIIIFRRMKVNEYETSALPKWEDNRNKNLSDLKSGDNDENQMWE